jgi:hypothetical protein
MGFQFCTEQLGVERCLLLGSGMDGAFGGRSVSKHGGHGHTRIRGRHCRMTNKTQNGAGVGDRWLLHGRSPQGELHRVVVYPSSAKGDDDDLYVSKGTARESETKSRACRVGTTGRSGWDVTEW